MGKSSRLRKQRKIATVPSTQANPYTELDRSTWDGHSNDLNAVFRSAAKASFGDRWHVMTATLERRGGRVVVTAGVKLDAGNGATSAFEELPLGLAELEAISSVVGLWAEEMKAQNLDGWGLLSFETFKDSTECSIAPVFAADMGLRGESYTRWLTGLGLGLQRLETIHGEVAASAVPPSLTEFYVEQIHALATTMLGRDNYVYPWLYGGILIDARDLLAEPVLRVASKTSDQEPFEYIDLDEDLAAEIIEVATRWRIALAQSGQANWMVLNLVIKTGVRALHFLQVRESAGERALPLLDKGVERLLVHYDGLYARGLDELLVES